MQIGTSVPVVFSYSVRADDSWRVPNAVDALPRTCTCAFVAEIAAWIRRALGFVSLEVVWQV
jgi:hypothetical protein